MNYREASRIANRARTAIENADWEALRYCGNRFERGRYYREAWKALAARVEGEARIKRPIWPGPNAACSNLLVLPRSRDLGDELRIIRFVAHAAAVVDAISAVVEPRLIPLLSRSFPHVTFLDRRDPIEVNQFSHIAAQERLAYWFGHDDAAIETSFQPLVSREQPTERQRGVGIAWFSRALGKTLPSLKDWAGILQDWPVRLQSLQYREQDAGFKQLSELSGRPIKTARVVNQIADLDGFAAQISRLRGVLTISNTTAHMAGALGIPCVVVLDNGIVTTWPYNSEVTPFYPQTRLIRRRDDSWLTTLQRGRTALMELIHQGSRQAP